MYKRILLVHWPDASCRGGDSQAGPVAGSQVRVEWIEARHAISSSVEVNVPLLLEALPHGRGILSGTRLYTKQASKIALRAPSSHPFNRLIRYTPASQAMDKIEQRNRIDPREDTRRVAS